MDMLIWAGTALAMVGICGVAYSMVAVARAKKTAKSDEDLRDAIKKMIPINLGTLFVAMIGLMMVIIGIMLG